MHIMADPNNEKFILHLSQCSVELYGLPCFSARREASLLYTTVAMVPMSPAAEKKQWGEGAVFYFPHAFLICPLL